MDYKNIIRCEAESNYTKIIVQNEPPLLITRTLKYFEEILSDKGFARIHKSYLVNVNAVVAYNKGKGGSVVLNNGKELLVSASKKSELLSYFK